MRYPDMRTNAKLVHWSFLAPCLFDLIIASQLLAAGIITARPADSTASAASDAGTKLGGGNICDVREFGAKGDGAHVDTVAIQSAIQACADQGGGIVRFVAGTYLSGSIQLKSNTTLVRLRQPCMTSPDRSC
jgi:hypothetical protein